MAKLNESGLSLNRKKYDLVQKIVERSGEAKNVVNMLSETDLYDGNISSRPHKAISSTYFKPMTSWKLVQRKN